MMISIEPQNGANVLELMRRMGLLPESPCNGAGICGKCRVKVLGGCVSQPSAEEAHFLTPSELDAGIRLACMTVPLGRIELDPLELLGRHGGSVLTGGDLPEFSLEPMVTAVRRKTEKNEPEDSGWAVCYGGELADLKQEPKIYGLAVDIGTTTVAAALIDLNTGAAMAEDGFINPQKAFGLDVLSRIHYGMEHPDGSKQLQNVIVQGIQRCAGSLAASAGISTDDIYEAAVGGNAAMLYALLGAPLSSLGVAPYKCAFTGPVTVLASELGLSLGRQARVYCVPAVSAYIGGDIVAGILASRIDEAEDTALLVDIGTNGELVLSRKGQMYACSCAAGPALEGMNISCGMRAGDGAVERVLVDGETVSLGVIGNALPRGICGSGLIEAVSQMVKNGIIGKSGRIASGSCLCDTDESGRRRIALDRERNIYLTQNDIRQVQLCKGAVLSGILTLMKQTGIEAKDIDRVIVAGQFGKHLNPRSLCGAGLIPSDLADRISYAGNSSMAGARLCLLSAGERRRAESIARSVDYIELSISPGYERLFAGCMQFGGS